MNGFPQPEGLPLEPHGCLSAREKDLLLGCARQALAAAIHGVQPPVPAEPSLTPGLKASRCCFVTLMIHDKLRGCIGNLHPAKPLYRVVMDNAVGAGLRDWRFAPVTVDELELLCIEVSVLSDERVLQGASPQELVEQIEPDVHGVVFRLSGNTATFLPQVWRLFPERTAFLGELCRKAGAGSLDWQHRDATLAVYTVECFSERQVVS